MTKSYIKIDDKLRIIDEFNLEAGSIAIRWVHSHDESKYNDEADEAAKVAAMVVPFCDGEEPYLMLNATDCIGRRTVKNETKAMVKQLAAERWWKYKATKSKKECPTHNLTKWKTPYDRHYGDDLWYLNPTNVSVRMMLLTHNLPTKKWQYTTKLQKTNNFKSLYTAQNTLCDHAECANNGTEEDMHHFICMCPRYEEERENMFQTIFRIQNGFNKERRDKEDPERPPIEFEQDIKNKEILKDIILPTMEMDIGDRMDIMQTICYYVVRTKRFSEYL